MGIHHAGERDHAHFGGAAADVHHHRAGRLFDRQAGADGGGHRLLNQIDNRRAGINRRVADGVTLHLGRAAGHADNDARRRRPFAAVYLADKGAEHFLGNVQIGNHTVFHRADGLDAARGAAEHFFRFRAHRQRDFLAGIDIGLHRHHRRFVQHNAFAFDVNQGIGGSQVDGQVVGKVAGEKAEHNQS